MLMLMLIGINTPSSAVADATMPPATTFPGETWEQAPADMVGIDPRRLERAIDHLRRVTGDDGVAHTVVIKDGSVIWRGRRADQPVNIWSCTKSLLSVCFGLLWDEGKVQPGDPAWRYMPALRDDYPAVTLEHLATFTSGYAHAGKQPLDARAPNFAPGEALHYGRESDLLAAILTRAADQPLETLFFDRIGEPIGITPDDMSWTAFDSIDGLPVHGGSGAPGAAVDIHALAMARLGWLMANDGVWDGQRLLSRRYVKHATTPHTDTDTPPFKKDGWYTSLPGNYGLNWWTNGPLPDGGRRWPSAPARTFALQGNRNNICFIVPDWKLVLVRLGADQNIDVADYDRALQLLDPNRQHADTPQASAPLAAGGHAAPAADPSAAPDPPAAADQRPVFYIDPQRGADDGDGSAARPWRTLERVADAGHLDKLADAGGTVLLRDGHHGSVRLAGDNAKMLTLAAAEDHRPTLSRLEITRGSNWTVRGLTVSPAFAQRGYRGAIVACATEGASTDIVIEDCLIYTAKDTDGWSVKDWKSANKGLVLGRHGRELVARNNYILNTRGGIGLQAPDSLCEGNVVTDFSADGIRVTRDGITVRHNIVKNVYVSMKDGDRNHDDAIQCFRFRTGSGKVSDVAVIGNIIINREDPDQPWPNQLQAIGFFDGPLVDFVVTDNVIAVDNWHGITLNDAQNASVERNVVWSPYGTKRKPWIMLAHRNKNNPMSKDNVVKNNYAMRFRFEVDDTEASDNRPSDRQIYEQALHRTLSQINERFGADHPVTGEPRLDF